tara:strand:- start:1021 stop:1422 length:402 start_codon:yes stop_codon:yes gene_type:complete
VDLKKKTNQKLVINLFKSIFIWWNNQTVGTFLYTLLYGKYVGKDEFENKYYRSNSGKRWVIYKNIVEASKIPSEWHLWIHFLKKNPPAADLKKFEWQKKHEENLTGTNKAYRPDGSLLSNSKKIIKKYETWKH